MSEAKKEPAIVAAVKPEESKAPATEAKKEPETNVIANPFTESVSYPDILKEIPEGTSLKDYYEGVLSDDEVLILESELKTHLKNIAKAKEAKEEKLTPKQK